MAYVPDDHKGFNPNLFLQTFSYREVLSAFTLALVLSASWEIFRFIQPEQLLLFTIVSGIIPILLLHIIYRLEHHRANSFLGRVVHTLMLVIFFSIFTTLNKLYTTGESTFDSEDILPFFFGFLFGVILLEGVVALIKFLFDLLKWRIL